jgi:hypothetical protein
VEAPGRARYRVTAQTLDESERPAAWQRIVSAPGSGYGDYETKTDRVIPVVRLTPA